MTSRLKRLAGALPCIGDVRGLGAMVAMELVKNSAAPMQPDAELTTKLVQAAGRRGLIILACGIYSNVIRFLAPLTISDALLKEGFNLFEQALREVSGLGAAGVRVGRGVKVLALRGELLHQPFELRHAALGGADRHAVLAARIPAGLARIQPVLQRTGKEPVGDIPQVGVLVLVCDAGSPGQRPW